MLAASASAFRALRTTTPSLMPRRMITITNGVEFDTIAREWRLKWSPDNDKASLAEVQKVLNKHTATIKKVEGVKNVQRVVCGGCQDYKVVISLPAEKWGAWVSATGLHTCPTLQYVITLLQFNCWLQQEAQKFAPEADFLAAVKAIPGVSQVETQTYTLMPVN